MIKPSYNERAWAAGVISEINAFASKRDRAIRSAGGEWSVKSGDSHRSLFPDVLLFGDRNQCAVLQGWELKMPDTPVTDSDLLDNAHEKSRMLGLSSFLVWNVVDAVLYRTNDDSSCPMEVKRWRCAKTLTRADVHANRPVWIEILHDILKTLDDWLESGLLARGQALPLQISGTFSSLIERWRKPLGDHLKSEAGRCRTFRSETSMWWRQVRGEHRHVNDQSLWPAMASEIILHWVVRLIFAHDLKRHYTVAAQVEQLVPSESPGVIEAEEIFHSISTQHDFFQIFRTQLGSERLPALLWDDLLAFNAFLCDLIIREVKSTVLAEALISIREAGQRKVAGQFRTPKKLATLMVHLGVSNVSDPVLDPCCGTGTITKAIQEFKLRYELPIAQAIATTWASDLYSLPLQLTTLALAECQARDETIRTFQHDALDLTVRKNLTFADARNGNTIVLPLPAFAAIIVNPPFVRFEDWDRDMASVRRLKTFLANTLQVELDGKTDFFAYVILGLWRMLEDGGRLVCLLPNAWLGSQWGIPFRKALAGLYHIEYVVTSGQGRWFQAAQVVANLVVLCKRAKPAVPAPKEITTFAVIDQSLETWSDASIDEMVDSLVLEEAGASVTLSRNHLTTEALDRYDHLGICWAAHFADLDWLAELEAVLTPMSDWFAIGRGERRGWDALFFPGENTKIEAKYLWPVLFSTASVTRPITKPDRWAFCCSQSLENLQLAGDDGALAWIRRFEYASNEKGKPLREALARPNHYWYELKPNALADLAVSMNPGGRLFFVRLRKPAFVNQRLIRLQAIQDRAVDIELCHTLLYSVVGCFYLEAMGFGRGLGALDLTATKLKNQMRMLNPMLVAADARDRILQSFANLCRRNVLPFTQEMRQEDRLSFEHQVLNAYGLEALLPHIIETTLRLHRLRLTAND